MVFTPTTLFKDIACPAGETCALVNCIFSHRLRPQTTQKHATPANQPPTAQESSIEPPTKRRKVIYESLKDKPLSRAELIRSDVAQSRVQSEVSADSVQNITPSVSHRPAGLSRPISPPTKKDLGQTDKDDAKVVQPLIPSLSDEKPESLNPRVVTPAPDSHSKRVVYVQHIHSDMTRLNRSINTSTSAVNGIESPKLKDFVLSDQALIKLALTEEEKIARDKPKLYGNLIRNRIAAYKRMKPEEWLEKMKIEVFVQAAETKQEPGAPKLEAAVSAFESLKQADVDKFFESVQIKDLKALAKYGYILEPPTEAQATEARLGVERSGLHEQCDRCGSRFRVFPDRDPETGSLTSNGPCHYHLGRRSFPTRQRTDAYTGGHEGSWRCCGQEIGTVGCTTNSDHVFKCSEAPSRLAAVMPFIDTPDNSNRRKTSTGEEIAGVVFDCEMGYTTNGFELIRLTALRFPTKECLLDVLVRPLGAVIDLNTRFSGVKPEHYTSAMPYNKNNPSTTLQVVPDPATARSLLCEFLDGDKIPLMGHAIDNDLNATRLCHSFLIDTIAIYPHPRGLPLRLGLQALTKKYLERDIQMGGSEGHDSSEDAAATSDLITLQYLRGMTARKDPMPLKRPISSPAEKTASPIPSSVCDTAEQLCKSTAVKRPRSVI